MIDWQTIAVAVSILAAVVYLLRHAFRKTARKAGCGGGCHCGKEQPKGLISSGDLVSRLRRRS
jgi:hypothetical protein